MPKEMGMPREMRMTNGTAARRNGRAANSVPGTQLSPRGHQVLSQSRKTDKIASSDVARSCVNCITFLHWVSKRVRNLRANPSLLLDARRNHVIQPN